MPTGAAIEEENTTKTGSEERFRDGNFYVSEPVLLFSGQVPGAIPGPQEGVANPGCGNCLPGRFAGINFPLNFPGRFIFFQTVAFRKGTDIGIHAFFFLPQSFFRR